MGWACLGAGRWVKARECGEQCGWAHEQQSCAQEAPPSSYGTAAAVQGPPAWSTPHKLHALAPVVCAARRAWQQTIMTIIIIITIQHQQSRHAPLPAAAQSSACAGPAAPCVACAAGAAHASCLASWQPAAARVQSALYLQAQGREGGHMQREHNILSAAAVASAERPQGCRAPEAHSLCQPVPANASQCQPMPANASLCQPAPAYASLR